MAQHSRPLPSPRTPAGTLRVAPLPATTPDDTPVTPPAGPTPPRRDVPSPGPVAHEHVAPSPAPAAAVAADPAVPWYRSEPWLALCMGAFVPILLAIWLPPALRVPLLGLGAALMLGGLALLARRDRGQDQRASP